MKYLMSLLLISLTTLLSAQIKIVEKKIDVNGLDNGFFITINDGTKKQIEKELKDELKSWKGKVSNKEYLFADDCRIKELGKEYFDVYATVQALTPTGITIAVKIDLGGAYLNSKDHPVDFQVFKKRLYDFAVKASKNVIEEEAKVEEKNLKVKNTEIESEKKRIEKNVLAIENAKKVILEAEEEIKNAEAEKLKKEAEKKILEKNVEAIREKKKAVK